MTLPGTFNTLTWVAMVADADTPAESLPLNGRVVGLHPADTAGMGSGPDNPGKLFGVRGYPRSGGPTGTEYVMVPTIPAAVVAAFNVIPGPQGWIMPASKATFANVGVALIDTYGIAASLVLGALGDMYNAAVAERDARVAQGF